MHEPCLQVYIPTYLCSQHAANCSDLHVQLLVCNFNSCVEDSTELSTGFLIFHSVPSIRKTGSYSVQAAAPPAKQADAWLDKRLEGKELTRLKNASLQELIAGGFGQTGSKLYAIGANHINQAVLGFTQTTTSFIKQQQLPRHISIPDVLNMQGQVARCYAESCFQKFVSDNLQRLRELSEADLIKDFAGLKLNLRQGFVSTGMGDLQGKLLTVAEAKKRKANTELQSRNCCRQSSLS